MVKGSGKDRDFVGQHYASRCLESWDGKKTSKLAKYSFYSLSKCSSNYTPLLSNLMGELFGEFQSCKGYVIKSQCHFPPIVELVINLNAKVRSLARKIALKPYSDWPT